MSNVIACIDGSQSTLAVCDYAAWASQRLDAPLTFLHVLDHQQYPAKADLSGNIGLGSREHLLQELITLDEQRSKLIFEQGKIMLSAAKERAISDGVAKPKTKQRHGGLLENLRELEPEMRLLVIGRQGESSGELSEHVGSQLESVIRVMHRPVLVTCGPFKKPEAAMIAFDGSATTQKGVDMVAASPLMQGMPIHLVMVGAETGDNWAQMDTACSILAAAGHEVHTAIRAGEVETTLHAYQVEQGIDLLVMGAYGHSRIRQFLVGSTTTNMLRISSSPVLLLR